MICQNSNLFFDLRDQRVGNRRRSFGNGDAGGFERLDFSGGSSLSSGNNRAGVTHSSSRRRSHSRDESRDRFFTIRLDPGGGFFFGRAADFADQDHSLGVLVVI